MSEAWVSHEFTTAVSTLGLPRWTRFAYGIVPATAAVATLVRNDSTLPVLAQAVLLVIAIAPFTVDGLANERADFVLRLIGFVAVVPLIVTGADRVVLWIPALLMNRNVAFGSNAVRLSSVVAAATTVLLAAVFEPHLVSAPLVLIGFVASLLAGLAAAQIVRLVSHLHATEQLLAVEAARAERRRFAREVHDVIAHSMTVTLLHLQAARLAFRTAPEDAEEALNEAERVGRASLDDLRRTVRLLSDESELSPNFPSELFDSLKQLVEGFTTAGADVNLLFSSDGADVPPVIAQGIYRIVQESLTNAVRHAPGGRVEVEVDSGATRIALRIENSLAPRPSGPARDKPGGGHGLRGMIERTALLGGHLEAGPTKNGWRVVGWLPTEAPPGRIES